MGKKIDLGVNSVARKVKKGWIGDPTGLARKIKKGWIGDEDGKARMFFSMSGGELKYYGTVDFPNDKNESSAVSNGKYALFGGGDAQYNTTLDVYAYDESLVCTTAGRLSNYYSSYKNRYLMATARVGGYALFAGGRTESQNDSSVYEEMYKVDAFDQSLTKLESSLFRETTRAVGASIGDHGIIAGGFSGKSSGSNSARAAAFDLSLTRKDITALRYARSGHAGGSNAKYAIFAGGSTNYNVVDAYDADLVRYTAPDLSYGRFSMGGANVGKYVLFCGGGMPSHYYQSYAEAYDTSLTKILATPLSVPRRDLSATSVEGYALFCGGQAHDSESSYSSNVVDAYDESLTRTTQPSLSSGRYDIPAASVGNRALVGGRMTIDVYQVD